MNISEDSNDRDFYAVRPDLVLRAADVFRISSSMLERGAKRLHSRAVAINADKEAGRWGRHQRSIITQYCSYTKTSGSDFLLPWQELVEHQPCYDGKEGISTRTGNRPLSTVVRLLVDADALKRARQMNATSIEALSDACGLPPILLGAMESGDWPEVAESTAHCIAENLGLPIAEIFRPFESADFSADISKQAPTTRHRDRMLVAQGALIALAISGGGMAIWRSTMEPSDDDRAPGGEVGVEVAEVVQELGGQRDEADDPVMISAPVVPALVGCWQWSNGLRIVVNADGNAINDLAKGPWHETGAGRFEVDWPDWTSRVILTADGQRLTSTDLFGVSTTATRIQGATDDFVGVWRWDNNSVVNIDPDGKMSLAFLNGTWSALGQQYIITWPIVDEITVSADGQSLSGHNQFDSFTASRMMNCP